MLTHTIPPMKSSLLALLIMAMTVYSRAEETKFSQTISPAEFEAAGLKHLTPEERAKLDRLVQVFADAQVKGVQKSAAAAVEAKRIAEAEAEAARQEARVAKDEAKAAKVQARESKANDRGFFAKAKVLVVPGTKIEYAEVRSTIEGAFEGWMGKTIFQLANGQRWQVSNSDERYFVPPRENVEVQIRPAALGGFWMFFPSLDKQVRVKLLSEK